MNNFKIVEKCPINLHGFTVPIGAMYGKDKHGVWVCLDYRIKRTRCVAKAHYAKVRNESGIFVNKLVTPAKYAYSLRIFRLRANFVGSRYDAGNRWDPVIEHSATTDKILELYDRYPEKCDQLDFGGGKVKMRINPQTGLAYPVNSISKRSAKKMTRPINSRVVREYTPFATPW